MDDRKPFNPADVNREPFPDPDEPKPKQTGMTYIVVIGGVLLTMIIVAVLLLSYLQF